MTQPVTALGKTPRGLAIHPVTHPSYTHLEKVRTVGADAPTLGKLAQQAHPGYRAVDHQEAADVHYAVGNFHAARAHQAASNSMAKSGELEVPTAAIIVGSTIAGRPIVAPWQSSCAEVYEGVDADLTVDQARMAALAIAPQSSTQDHLDCAVAYQALAEALLPDPRGELAAAAAFIHFAGAGQDPLPMVAPDAAIDGVPDVVDAPLVKADPTRVLGHTKGGRPVHEGPALVVPKGHVGSPLIQHGAAVAASHPSFGHSEHWDASHIHATEARKHTIGSPEHTHHTNMANGHIYAIAHKKASSMLKSDQRAAVAYLNKFVAEATGVDMVKGSKGQGSRGGVIVGFRPDGSPVYGSRRTRARVARVLAEGHPQKNTDTTEKSEGMMITLSKAMGEKTGEGSRGGRVIGHTKSGKPVYAESHEMYSKPVGKKAHVLSEMVNGQAGRFEDIPEYGRSAVHHMSTAIRAHHPDFSKQDHKDAHEIHTQVHGRPGAKLTVGDAHKFAASRMNRDEVSRAHTAARKETLKNTTERAAQSYAHTHRKIGYGVSNPVTGNGHAIPDDDGGKHYAGLDHVARSKAIHADLEDADKAGRRGPGSNHMEHQKKLARKDAKVMAPHFEGWSKQDHLDAADHHTDLNFHQAALAHEVLAGKHKSTKAKKSLAGLHQSDPLHQMGSQFASKYPNMSASDHIAAANKHSKAGMPHLAIGHMLAATKLHSAAQKSMPVNILTDFVKSFRVPKAAGTIGTTQSGKPIHAPSSDGMFHLGKVRDYSHQDHLDAAAAHQGMADKARTHWGKMVQGMAKPHNKTEMRDRVRATYDAHKNRALTHRDLAAHMAKTAKSMDAAAPKGDWFRDSLSMFTLSKAEKEGEGSRGGHVIGHTRNGRPIYGPSHEKYTTKTGAKNLSPMDHAMAHKWEGARIGVSKAYKDFNAGDHADAADAHRDMAHDLFHSSGQTRTPDVIAHEYAGAAHSRAHMRQLAKVIDKQRAPEAKAASLQATTHSKRAHSVSEKANRTGAAKDHIAAERAHMKAAVHHEAMSKDTALNRDKREDHDNAVAIHTQIARGHAQKINGEIATEKSMTAYLLKNEHLLAEALGHAVA